MFPATRFARAAVVVLLTAIGIVIGMACGDRHCAKDSDCGGDVCTFDPYAGCSAQGICRGDPNNCGGGAPASVACGCDGKETSPCSGIASVPIRHFGGCALEGERCGVHASCSESLACAFRVDEGCAAEGQCVRYEEHCSAQPVVVGCGCMGYTMTRPCHLPLGFAGGPVATTNACDDGGTDSGNADARPE